MRTLERAQSLKALLPIYRNKLDARLAGELQLRSDAAGRPRATGTVRVARGTYTYLGKQLDIQRGVFRFDGPLTNPAVDILAMNEQPQVKVGVSVTGTALNPRAQLVSDPDVPDQEKLSWLLFGRGGQSTEAAVGGAGAGGLGLASFGWQLSEKLYVGYEQGTAGAANVMTLYSRLTNRLTVEARSGEASSLRLFYTYELKR